MLELIVISTLNGVLFGMLLFLMASGLTVIFSMLGVLNFAHASFYMLGAFFGFQIARWFGFWPALLISPLLAGAIGMAVERYGLRHVHRNGHVAELLFTFGLAFAIEEVVQMIWGKSPVDFRVPEALDFPAFKAGDGAIVNMASVAGVNGLSGLAGYVAGKAGIIGLTKAAALDYADRGIRINVVAPGPILTHHLEAAGPEAQRQAGLATPMRRIGRVEEVASAVLWLCSDEASFITGAVLPIDGGQAAGNKIPTNYRPGEPMRAAP